MKPSRLLLGLLAGLFAAAVLLGALPLLGVDLAQSLLPMAWGLALALSAIAIIDGFWLRQRPSPRLQRELPGNLPLGRWSEVQLTAHHDFTQALEIEVFDHVPEGMAFEHLPQRISLHPGQQTRVSYRLKPLVRGHFHFARCELLLPSPLRLWQARRVLQLEGESRVYPDFARLYGAQLKAVDDWLSQLGVRQRPRRGLGLEFHQLREFRDGDTLRQIDWKATARKRTPIAREYQDERDQQIVFLLDCGRRMRSQDDELSHFDHALNACLLLSYVALRQGDAVGLATFASQQPRYLAPVKGPAQLNVLLNAVYDLETSQLPADFSAAADLLLARQRRRSLVVVVTNLRDEDDHELLAAVRRLSRQHRVLIASLREEALDRLRQTPVEQFDQAIAYCGTLDYLNARADLHERLAAHDVPVLDARPGELGPELVSSYLAWKKAGAL
ncbi:hypothetical protein FIV02_17615 [Pseudomonas sp. THAF187a]|uniref:DUF58 domain-containing protein n=1 Tax=Ectopseudomonas khazarica TaxID=2502979 RepID=A0ABW7MIG5_9GAMM|nr:MULTISPECIES: DUF58 domain-containing protein [Pseudomonas]TNF14887.1 MAG: DUF58 domain-containing protein [Pseudomonadales bacterium]HIQ42314.1 DUF58 domain-containing protein [Pseudomonas oleovorans]QFT23392.1 hypothetical protein FIV02_17615 [Pseudomonas sp. THAF187a]QFT43580.1 hypothetical protein FIU98_17600 [Pseudomonas sp. THAF42]QTS85290.1 DUF58 domain-containing protein [Pseudomonas khazarica]|tara:strand:+ start:28303 stop:29634 length:1332 start_codon:yes stop_codon:yes gene_type:complete